MLPASNYADNDALLVAYVDDELEPERRQELEQRLRSDASLRERLMVLAEGGQKLRSSFDALLNAAPRARLHAAFATALTKGPRFRARRYREMLLAAAAALLLLICGGVAGYLIAKGPAELFEEADAFEEGWIAAVAGQLALYDAASVAAIPANDAETQAQLAKLEDALKLDLSEPRVTLQGLTLKRAELLHFQGRKVAELLYASAVYGPIAFCIAAEPGGEGEGEAESRDDLNLMYWTSSGRRFLLIGAAPPERINALAATMGERFGS